MLIEIHMIQNHSPSNLNRDDLGAPKTCLFGDVTRARISSQCLKRSIRNPGNPEDMHNRGPNIFAEAMRNHIGTKTKFFPWLVEQALADSSIPVEEHPRVVLAAKRIAVSKEKEGKRPKGIAKSDSRPKTAQLIHLGPGHANYFIQRLDELRKKNQECYDHFLNPVVGFRELVREYLSDSTLEEKEQEKIIKVSWVIAKCRMAELLKVPDGQEPEPEPSLEGDQPSTEHAKLIAEHLSEIFIADSGRFKNLTKPPTKEENNQLKITSIVEPKGMPEFMAALKTVNHHDAVDIALFGRMTTSDAFQDVEAAMQVAHAISTHAVVNEVDYFTAVDDLGKAGGGAGHVDEAMFNSACFYKYFCLDWDQLVRNIAGQEPDKKKDPEGNKKWIDEVKPQAIRLASATLGHFLRAAALTSPGGKQNSFASNCEPCGILVEIKKTKIPTSYANAFAEPVRRIGMPDDDAPDEKSIEGRSVACLSDHVQSIRKAYGFDSKLFWYSPKLWRFPLQYWERSADGKKSIAKPLTEHRYDVLGGADAKQKGLIEAVVGEFGFDWPEIKDVGRVAPKEV